MELLKEYSVKLAKEIGKKYSVRYLFDIRKLYLFSKVHPLGTQLTMSHYRLLFTLKDDNEITYYMNQVAIRKLSKRELESIIKSNKYKRVPKETKDKLISKEKTTVIDFVKNPIIIKNKQNETVSEKVLQKLILEDISSFLKELGTGFTFVDNEYPIKIGDQYNYIDLLLFNYEFNCFVVIELKVTELKKEHIGQIEVYMNIDENIKKINQDKTIGIIICKNENKYIIKYCSDKRIVAREYIFV